MSRRVLLPDPEGPTRATNSASSTVRLSPSRAGRRCPPSSYVETISSSSRRGARAGLIVRPPSIADGIAREIVGDKRGNLIAEAYAVVGASILRIDLGRVGQIEPRKSGAVVGNPLAVVEGNDRLGRSFAKDPGSFDPGAAEIRINPFQEWDVGVDQLLIRHREVGMVRFKIFREVDEPFATVLVG